MENLIIIIAVILVVGFALFYIIKAKKSGKKCIGCPNADSCQSKKCNCHSKEN